MRIAEFLTGREGRLAPLLRLLPELFRFGQIGALVFVAYLAASLCLSRIVGLDQVTAAVVATTFSAAVSYLGHGRYTFAHDMNHRSMLPRFAVSVVMAYVLSYVVARALTALTGWPDYAVYLAVVCVIAGTNFLVFRFWVFVTKAPLE